MSNLPRISAVICTYNRCRYLRGSLASLAQQSLDPSEYEVIVVDNASTDATAEVVKQCQALHGERQIRIVREPRQGLFYARNTGFQMARGRYVAYLDDDAIAAPEWLQAGLETFEEALPKPAAVAGPVRPKYEGRKPKWLNDRFETFDLGPQTKLLREGQSFVGANMMFRKEILEEIKGFDRRFCIQGNQLLLGDEVELLLRMRRRFAGDCSVYYVPAVSVDHVIPAHKLRVPYILRRRYINGQSRYLMLGERNMACRTRSVLCALAWMSWLSFSALLHAWQYRNFWSWLTERGAPVMMHVGMLAANLRGAVPAELPNQHQAASKKAQGLAGKAA